MLDDDLRLHGESTLIHPVYQRGGLPRLFREVNSQGDLIFRHVSRLDARRPDPGKTKRALRTGKCSTEGSCVINTLLAGSQLRAIGLPGLVATGLADYETLLLRLAREPSLLAR